MCGIIAYVGPKSVVEILMEGLGNLEYRGYDSAGVTLRSKDSTLKTMKKQGKLLNLRSAIDAEAEALAALEPEAGIGHTRWATHGEPNDVNSHPHNSTSNAVSVVHNGIIENKEELKQFLESKGIEFVSETDTEVIPKLIEYHMANSERFLDAFLAALSQLQGAYGLAVLHRESARVYGARLGSPLCIGLGDGEHFIASDPSAFVRHTRDVIHLRDNEVCIVRAHKYTLHHLKYNFDDEEELSSPKSKPVDVMEDGRVIKCPFVVEDIRKGEYAHFMLKEINDQARAVQNTIGGKLKRIDGINVNVPEKLNGVCFLACGTSWHAGLIGEYILENMCGIPTQTKYASEMINRRCLLNANHLAIAVSQSGETADTRDAIIKAQDSGAKVAGIINVVGSQIARITGNGMYLHAGPEIGVASTKAFTCQVAAMCLLAAFLSKDEDVRKEITEGLTQVPTAIQSMLDDAELHKTVEAISEEFHTASNALYLGRGIDFPVALEGALKLKEISYIHAEGYASGEMKHGPIALIDANMPVFVVVGSEDEYFHKMLSNVEEVKARHGRIITITTRDDEQLNVLSDYVIKVPDLAQCVSPIIKSLPLQLISYHIAVKKGLDPDRPRNLAKSVTVL